MVVEHVVLEGIGFHCMLELYDCPSRLLNDEMFVKRALQGAVEAGWATLLHEVSHKFQPQGVTALALIAESHVAIHTWPEHGYAAADVFTCGDRANAQRACMHLIGVFEPGRHALTKIIRGAEAVEDITMAQPPAAASG